MNGGTDNTTMDDNTTEAVGRAAEPGRVAVFAVFAALGGVVREMAKEQRMTVARFFVGAAVGAFTGMVIFCCCRYYKVDDYVTGAATGLGGYVGTPLLDALWRSVRRQLRRAADDPSTPTKVPREHQHHHRRDERND